MTADTSSPATRAGAPADAPAAMPPLPAWRMHVVTVFSVVWTMAMSVLAMVLHMLSFGVGDPSMFVARRLWAPALLRIAGIRLDLRGGGDLVGDRPYIAVANHQSILDILVMFVALPRLPIRFIAKEILFWVPLFGWYLWLAGYVAVDRGNPAKARRSLERAARRIRTRRSTIVVFPEGTRTPDGSVRRFKKGAFVLACQCGAPIVPVALAGGYAVMNRHRWMIHPGTLHARVLPVIPTDGLGYDDRDALADRARAVIEQGVEALRREFGISEAASPAEAEGRSRGSAPATPPAA